MGEAVPPSKVIHVRNLGEGVSEQDLHQLAQTFGQVQRVVLMRHKNQALVEMPDVAAAMNMVQFYSGVQPNIRGRNVYLGYSSHQQLTTNERSEGNGSAAPHQLQHQHHQRGEAAPNRVLLVTVHNPLYPINVDVLHQVFSPHGSVEKIVLFQKSAGLQALVQYGQQQSAVLARTQLQGRNIYDGCCTLEIQFSNLPELQVHANNDRTRDYTNNALPEQVGRGGPGGNMQGSLFGEGGNSMYGAGHMRGFPPQHGGMGMPGHFNPHMNPMASAAAVAPLFGGQLPPGITATNIRCTLLASNINTEFVDDDKLFNLFSNYGNVLHIKFLHNKPDHALIEMAEGIQAEMALLYCKGVTLFGKKLELNYSKHANISATPDLKDYSLNNPLNRFSRNSNKNYRHCCAPTKMLHVSSLPQDVTEPMVVAHLTGFGTIVGSKMIEKDGKRQVLVLFDTPEAALDTLVSKHGSDLGGATIRLAFSKQTSL